MGYLDDLIGYKDVRDGETLLPRRAAISFSGGVTVEDDPINEQTVVTFGDGSGGEVVAISYQGELGGPFVGWFIDDAGFAAADLVRIETLFDEDTVILKLLGMEEDGLEQPRKVLVNVGTESIWLQNEAGDDGPSFVLAEAEFELRSQASVEVMWMDENGDSPAGWRLLGGV